MVQDIHSSYVSNGYTFINYIELSDEEKKLVWEWRNTEGIRKWMYNKDFIPFENHIKFISLLPEKTDSCYWLVYNKVKKPIGAFYLAQVDKDKEFAEIGYYMNPSRMGDGLAFLKECIFFFFNVLCFTKPLFGVYYVNKEGYMLDSFLGCVFDKRIEVNNEEYFVSTNLNKEIFMKRYNLSLSDYVSFIRKFKQ